MIFSHLNARGQGCNCPPLTTLPAGGFSLVVPYFSEYTVRVVGEDKRQNVVVFETPKHCKHVSAHEIVIIFR